MQVLQSFPDNAAQISAVEFWPREKLITVRRIKIFIIWKRKRKNEIVFNRENEIFFRCFNHRENQHRLKEGWFHSPIVESRCREFDDEQDSNRLLEENRFSSKISFRFVETNFTWWIAWNCTGFLSDQVSGRFEKQRQKKIFFRKNLEFVLIYRNPKCEFRIQNMRRNFLQRPNTYLSQRFRPHGYWKKNVKWTVSRWETKRSA